MSLVIRRQIDWNTKAKPDDKKIHAFDRIRGYRYNPNWRRYDSDQLLRACAANVFNDRQRQPDPDVSSRPSVKGVRRDPVL